MAEVFRAKLLGYQGFEKIVAIKRILPEFAQNTNFKKMFVHEANLSATLEHPNIAHVFANGENNGFLYLIMEYIDGHNLRELIKKSIKQATPLSREMSIYIVTEVLKGLEYAHTRNDKKGNSLGIVHRDVSPQNIMLSYEGTVKLVDFGIARLTNTQANKKNSKAIVGKFSYMSPEQAKGDEVDRRSDIFSTGIVLWELLVGKKLYEADTDEEIISLAEKAIIPEPSEITGYLPSSLEKIVMKALNPEKEYRYQSCLEFYSDLIRYQNSKRSDFIPTDFAAFMRNFFKDEILEKKLALETKPTEAIQNIEPTKIENEIEVTHISLNSEEITDVTDLKNAFKHEDKLAPISTLTEKAGMVELAPLENSPSTIKVLYDNPTKKTPYRPRPPFTQPTDRKALFIKTFTITLFLLCSSALFYFYAWPLLKKLIEDSGH